MKQLIIYFSHVGENIVNGQKVILSKGNTEIIAERIQEFTGADMYQIKPVTEYPSTYHECNELSRKENESNVCADILDPLKSVAEYDVIYIGFPIWHRSFPAIVAKFIRMYDFTNKIVLPFCTNDEGGFGTAELELKFFLKGSDIRSGLAIHGSKTHVSDEIIKNWVIK